MPLADQKAKYSFKELRRSSSISSENHKYMKIYYPSIRHDPHEGFFYGFLCLIYDGLNTIEELKAQMRLFFLSATKQVVVEDQDVEEYLQYAKKKQLITEDPSGKIHLTQNGEKLVEVSYYSTLHASYWMNLIFNAKTILVATAIFLIILSSLKVLVGLQLASQGMINEGFENLTDLIKIVIIYLIAFRLKKDKLASIIIILMMMITGVFLIWSGIEALINPRPITPTVQAYMICFFSIILNLGLMYLKSLVGRTSGNLSLMSDSKDSGLNVKISLGVAIGLTFAIFKIYFVDALVGIIIAILVFKEGIEVLRELIVKEEKFDITAIKVIADQLYDDRLTGYILGSIRREYINKEKLLKNFEQGLSLGRQYYVGFADFFYHDLGTQIAEKHLNKLIKGTYIERLGDQLILTPKGLQTYYKAKAKEYNNRAKKVYVGPRIHRGYIYCIFFLISFILLIFYANDINRWLMSF
ncbi:MAG: cation diffusion facilitator family transporter [Promethearchaeota archaeon]